MPKAGLPALLHFVCILGVTVSSQFPSSLVELCPYSSFCGHNKKTINVSKGYQTCCRSCSCDSDCGLKRNCCFYEGDYYRIEEKGETSCVAPIHSNISSMKPIGRYFMKDKCPGANDTCRSMKAAGWGNLFPHLSHNTGLIYYNQFCARCHNDSNVVPWILSVKCPIFDYEQQSLNSYSFEIQKLLTGQSSKCSLNFREPEDIDLSSAFCNLNVIQECSDIYPTTDIDAFLKLEEQCHRFNATFAPSSFQSQVFRNVYCYLCSEPKYFESIKVNDICIAHNNNYFRQEIRPGNLIMILGSYDTYESVTDEKGEKMVCHKIRKVKYQKSRLFYLQS
ncbi:hypothetical protein DPMN_034486 [Dreissena polymorpha]|uniref:Uncharacterized protein n=1 Tax=Dreissena polymorpha TaxID=45954 RepID=A0A9D4RK49_DREPO|nr:hypothetical protein DPMN_034486 [Dreissena polymorpha]